MPTTFHDASKPWARIKHGLLRGYLSLFLGKLGSAASKVYYVDGFAGSGKLGDGSDGSPIFAARLATNPPTKSTVGKLRCINVEKEVFAELESAMAQFVMSGLVKNIQGSFEDALPAILEETEGFPALFFIDPFGTEGAVSSTIEKIAKRSGPTEVLIRYDDTRVKRLIKWVHSHRDSLDDQQRRTAEAFQQRCNDLTEEQTAQAVIELLADGDREGSREILIASYLKLITDRTSFQFSLHFPIRNPNTRGHKYYFAHFCQHPDGYIYMADHMAQAQRAYDHQAADFLMNIGNDDEPGFPSILAQADDQVNQQNVSLLVRDIPRIIRSNLSSGVSTQNRNLYRWIVDAFNWQYLRKEYCAALRNLRDQGLVRFADQNDNSSITLLK